MKSPQRALQRFLRQRRKSLVFVVLLMPLLWLGWQLFQYAGNNPYVFGADPGKEIVHYLGEWALRILLLTLALTPLQDLLGWRLVPLRRMLGLYAFFYALLHLLAYLVFLLELDFAGFWADIVKRPYITMGMLALLGMVPLAVTSTRGMQRRLGKNWKKLHRLVYPIAGFAIIHLFWQTRSDFSESLLYSALLAWEIAHRVYIYRRQDSGS